MRVGAKGEILGLCGGCGKPVADVRWSRRYKGVETVRADGSACCSEFEGDYPTAASAARQLEMYREHVRRRQVDATTPTTTHDSGGFRRTAIVVDVDGNGGSLDLVSVDGVRLGQVNVFLTASGTLMVDVIDVDERYAVRRALAFPNGARHAIDDAGKVVGVHFQPKAVAS